MKPAKNKYKKWTPEEVERLRKEYRQGLSTPQIAKRHNRPEGAIRAKLRNAKIREKQSSYDWWTEEEIKILVELKNKNVDEDEIVEKVGRNKNACRGKWLDIRKKRERKQNEKEKQNQSPKTVGETFKLKDDREFEIVCFYPGPLKKVLCQRVGIGYREMFFIDQIEKEGINCGVR